MLKETKRDVVQIRSRLGRAMRKATGAVGDHVEAFENGFRWEPDDVLACLLAADDLLLVVRGIEQDLMDLASRATLEVMTESERRRVRSARAGVKKAMDFLGDIDGKRMVALADLWVAGKADVSAGHEVYFIRRFSGAMRILQLAWNALFFATNKAVPSKMQLTEPQSKLFYDKSTGFHRLVREQAEHKAEQLGEYVEVIDAAGRIAYVAQPPVEHLEAAARRVPKGMKARMSIANPGLRADAKEFAQVWSRSW